MVAADLISRVFTIVKIHDHQGQTQNHGTLIMNAKNHLELAAWPGFARPPARGVLVVLVQDIS